MGAKKYCQDEEIFAPVGWKQLLQAPQKRDIDSSKQKWYLDVLWSQKLIKISSRYNTFGENNSYQYWWKKNHAWKCIISGVFHQSRFWHLKRKPAVIFLEWLFFPNNTGLFTNRFFIHFYNIFNCPVFTVIWSLKYQSCVLFYLSVYLAESSLSIEKPKSPKDYLEIYPRAISVGYRWSTCVVVCFTGCWIMWFISSWEIFHCFVSQNENYFHSNGWFSVGICKYKLG